MFLLTSPSHLAMNKWQNYSFYFRFKIISGENVNKEWKENFRRHQRREKHLHKSSFRSQIPVLFNDLLVENFSFSDLVRILSVQGLVMVLGIAVEYPISWAFLVSASGIGHWYRWHLKFFFSVVLLFCSQMTKMYWSNKDSNSQYKIDDLNVILLFSNLMNKFRWYGWK